MFNSDSAIYGLKYHSRAIAPQLANTDQHQFLVGTMSLKEENEVHLIEFDEYSNQIQNKAVYAHPNEVWSLSPCPFKTNMFFSVHNDVQRNGFAATLWRAPDAAQEVDADADASNESKDDQAALKLKEVVDLGDYKDTIVDVLWEPADPEADASSANSGGTKVVSVHDSTVRLWELEQGLTKLDSSKAASSDPSALKGPITAASWDPHHVHKVVAANGQHVSVLDLRSMQVAQQIDNAHAGLIHDVDFNPNKPYHCVSGGEDRMIKFWDLRKDNAPLAVLNRHTHWVHRVNFNRFHDQLVLSAGTDGSVALWSIVSISSAPLGDLEDPANEKEGDKLIKQYDEHEESVYATAWSCCDAWIFATLSYDGRVVVNHVPPAEKYKILL